MCQSNRQVQMGFTRQTFSPGVHICQIFSDDNERMEVFLKFLQSGIMNQEAACCFSERFTKETLETELGNLGVEPELLKNRDALLYAGAEDTYFKDDVFNPDSMLQRLGDFYDKVMNDGFDGARVIGEMTPKISDVHGGDRLLEYESKVSLLLKERPVTTMCQYDARNFQGELIMEVLKVHPYILIRGAVVNNPFFISPEEFLAKN